MLYMVQTIKNGQVDTQSGLTAQQAQAIFLQKKQAAYGVANMIQVSNENDLPLKIDVLIGTEQIFVRSMKARCCCFEKMGDNENCSIHRSAYANPRNTEPWRIGHEGYMATFR